VVDQTEPGPERDEDGRDGVIRPTKGGHV
jgi:hypothetical protein